MIDRPRLEAQARRRRYQTEFLESYADRRNQIHPDDQPWCDDDGDPPCARCAPLVNRLDEIRADLPKLVVWIEDLVEAVLYRYWRIRIRMWNRRNRRNRQSE